MFLRHLVPLLVSALALIVVFFLTDLEALRGLAFRVRWDQLPGIALLTLAIVCAFGLRWRTLLREALPIPRSVLVCALGIAGNQLLPLRGGDALRVVLSTRGARAPSLHVGVSALVLEKVFDLAAVAGLALISASALIGAHDGSNRFNVFAAAGAVVGITVMILLMARRGLLTTTIRQLSRVLRIRPRLYRHLFRPLHHLQQLTSPGRVAVLLIQTAFIWMVLYVLAYLAVAKMVGIQLTVADTMVLLCAGALGVAIPAAPSGLGTFHAAIVSAFLILGRPVAEGLVLAVAIHGVFFVGLCAIGAVALVFATHRLGPVRLL